MVMTLFKPLGLAKRQEKMEFHDGLKPIISIYEIHTIRIGTG